MILPKYLNTIDVTGVLPGTHQDVNNLLPGDTVYYCDKCKNRLKKEFYVLAGTIDSWDPIKGMYDVRFLVQVRRTVLWYHKTLFSNEVGNTPKMAVNNMLRLPWEQYS
jgi:hypothetical protein